jgi:hypothetical protein
LDCGRFIAALGTGVLEAGKARGPSSGSAHSQVILPEHRQAVRKFFKQDEK